MPIFSEVVAFKPILSIGISKINPHRDNILKSLSSLLKIPVNKIGLKATTSEKIGIIGKNQAIAVQSIVNLRDKK